MSTRDGLRLGQRPMDHPRSSIRPLSILDLPLDVLHVIFAFFQGPDITCSRIGLPHDEGSEDARLRIKVVQRARLTCRLFHTLASPLMFRILKVELSQESLDLAERVSKTPLLAAGVRAVCVSLDFRPGNIAHNLQLFAQSRIEGLEAVLSRHGPFKEGTNTPRMYLDCVMAWAAAGLNFENEATQTGKRFELKQLLCRCHQEYCKRHEEQLRLVSEGSFARSLAASMSQMQNATALRLASGMDCYPPPSLDDLDVLDDSDALRDWLVGSHDWDTIEKLCNGAELFPARLLSELPIAIHRAGVDLHHLGVRCFPVKGGYSFICPERPHPTTPAWTDLQAACRSLETFSFGREGIKGAPILTQYDPGEDKVHIDKYMAAVLSGQRLKNVGLNFRSYGTDIGDSSSMVPYHLGSVLARIQWPDIRDVDINAVAMELADLEAFCGGLGLHVVALSLCHVQLKRGRWSDALDLLRGKLASRCAQGACKLEMNDFTGGDFWWPENRSEAGAEECCIDNKARLMLLSEGYVKGEVDENPLRGVGKDVAPSGN